MNLIEFGKRAAKNRGFACSSLSKYEYLNSRRSKSDRLLVRVAWTADLKQAEARQAVQLAEEHQAYLLEKWNEFFHRTNP